MQDHDWVMMGEGSDFKYESIIIKDFSMLGLVVTADNNLNSLSDSKDIISSEFWHLFPKSQQNFIHNNLLKYYPFDGVYLTFNNCKEQLKCILSIIARNLPSLSRTQAAQAPFEGIEAEWIKNLFDCLANDPIFFKFYDDILMKLPLLPASNNILYSASSKLLPLKTIVTEDRSEINYNIDSVKRLMLQLQIPLFRHDILCDFKETRKVQLRT